MQICCLQVAANKVEHPGDKGNDRGDDQAAPVGPGEISAVDIGPIEAEHDQENESNDGNNKQDLEAEISPGTQGLILLNM